MTTPASSSSSVSVTSSNLPISLAALTNNFSTHLNSDNYLLWRDQITPLLICNDLYGHIDGSDPPPSKTIINEGVVTPNPDYTRWFKIDQLVVGGIKNTLSSTACAEVLGKHVAKDVWDTLETLFHQQTLSRADILHDTLLDTYKNDMSIEAYLAKIKGIADQLAAISQPVPDSELVKRTLRGLPHTLEYQPFAQGIANRHTPITFTELRARLLVHEQELERIRGRAAPPLSSPSHHAFVTQQHYQQSRNPHHGNYRRFNRPKQGTVSQNFGNSSASILGQYPTQNSPSFADFSNKSFNNNGQHGRNRFQNGNNYGNRPQFGRSRYRGRCQICKQEGHSASNCNYRYTRSDSTNSDNLSAQFAGVHVSELTAPTEGTLDCVSPHWLGDTGATNHMASNTDLVQQPLPFNGTSGVYVGNGASLSISHIGNSSINLGSKSLSLKDILVVPQLKENLISIAKLTTDNYCVFACFPWGFVIKDLATGVILLKGPVKDNLYPIPAHALSAAFRKLSCHSAIARTAKIAPCSTWHRRLGHPGSKILQQLVTDNLICTSDKLSSMMFCDACQAGKSKHLPFHLSGRISSHVLELVHCDIWGPSPVITASGYRYYIIFVDDYSRFCWLYPLKQRSDSLACFTNFKNMGENQFNQRLKLFQCDGAKELIEGQFRSFLDANGIYLRVSCPHTSQQNGIAERKHRHIREIGLSLLHQAFLPKSLWLEAFSTAIFLINRLPTPVLSGISPYEALFGTRPDYTLLRTFGCSCYPFLGDYGQDKLSPKSRRCVFIGYSTIHRGYRCLDSTSGRVFISRHVVFNEAEFPYELKSIMPSVASQPAATPSPAATKTPLAIVFEPLLSHSSSMNDSPTTSTCQMAPSSSATPTTSTADFSPVLSSTACAPPDQPALPSTACVPTPPPAAIISNNHPMITRAKDGIRKPRALCVSNYPLPNKYIALLATSISREPASFKAASLDSNWIAAMKDEYRALIDNQTWSLVPRSPSMNVVGCRWVYKLKERADGSIERHKARLVAKGFNQEQGVDFTNTFSPVAKATTVRILLSIGLSRQWSIRQLDVKNAFLHGALAEEVYMSQPPGFIDSSCPDYVCKLHRSIYGLRQAPRVWFQSFSQALLSLGFQSSQADNSLFTLHSSAGSVLLLVYVDDIIITGSTDSLINHIVNQLSRRFHMKDLGDLHYFLGLEVHRSSGHLRLTQTKYLLSILSSANMIDCKPQPTPVTSGRKLSMSAGLLLPNPHEYRRLVGALQYLTFTRPDISYSVQQVCQFMHSPRDAHLQAVKRILRYLKGTPSLGINFSANSPSTLSCFVDADWAGCPDTRRSTMGHCVFIGHNLISWSAKKQLTVALSSTESEYKALSHASADLLWISYLLRDIGFPAPLPCNLFSDNMGATQLAHNPVFHARTKHVELSYHFVRELVSKGFLQVSFVRSSNQLADIFTKGLPSSQFCYFRDKLMWHPPHHLAGG